MPGQQCDALGPGALDGGRTPNSVAHGELVGRCGVGCKHDSVHRLQLDHERGTELASGAFTGSTSQPLLSVSTSSEIRVCLLFQFANATIYPPGTYSGQLTYSLQMP
ncbi:MAG: hypothetical protein IPP91_15040 [Betaproteobacteria bacterium]|nr:hypothetical protein [Betaproteobacteria bacterium]